MDKINSISFSLRGVSADLDKNISAIAMMENVSKNKLILDVLSREFSNPLSTFARKSPLVNAMDKEISEAFDCQLIENWYENEHIIYSQRKYCKYLSLENESDVDRMFKENISLIELRASQIAPRANHTFALGISLTCSLFIQVAKSDPQCIEEVRNNIFFTNNENFTNNINSIRKELNLPSIDQT